MHNFQCVPALYLCNKLFRYMSPMVIKWSASNEQFELQGKSHCNYWIWCFNTFIVAGVIGFGSCNDIIAHKEEAGSSLVVISSGFASLSILFWTCAAVLIWNRDELVGGISDLKNVLKYVDGLASKEKFRFRTGASWHLASYGIKLAVQTLAIVALTMGHLCLWVGLDPFSYTFPKIVSAFQICDSTHNATCSSTVLTVMIFLRTICSVICITKACRFFGVLFCMLIYILELVVRCMEVISHVHLKCDCLSFSISYTALRISHKVLRPPPCSLFALILGDGFTIILCCNIATIRAYTILPMEAYWLMSVVSVLFSFFVAFALPYAVKVYNSSEEMLHARKVILSNNRKTVSAAKRKLDKRETVAIRPIV